MTLHHLQLYADDTKIYREIKDPKLDTQILQADLDNLSSWAAKWQLLRFNGNKCEAMWIMHSCDKSSTSYSLGTPLKDVSSFKDLGVTIPKDLWWSEYIGIIVNKANKVLGLINPTVGTANRSTFPLLYKSLVRALLEYAALVRNPYLVNHLRTNYVIYKRFGFWSKIYLQRFLLHV